MISIKVFNVEYLHTLSDVAQPHIHDTARPQSRRSPHTSQHLTTKTLVEGKKGEPQPPVRREISIENKH